VVLHSLEHDDAAARRSYLGLKHLEARSIQRLDLVLDQQLDRVLEALLNLTDAGRSKARPHYALLDQ
jgi:hypothetical protein